jgi:hypothetical protein
VDDYSEYAIITIGWTDAEADHSAWAHFKTVDTNGDWVAEIPGSDLVDLNVPVAETPARRDLVDRLRSVMIQEGWTELGTTGEAWYEYVFGR